MVYALQKFKHCVRRALQDVHRSFFLEIIGQQARVRGKICRWLLLFQEYDFEVIVKPGRLNAGPNHLSRIKTREEPNNLEEGMPDAQLFTVHVVNDHFADIIHFLTMGMAQEGYTCEKKKELVLRMADFFKYCEDMWHTLSGTQFLLKLMRALWEAIMQARQLCRRFCVQVYGGQLCTRIPRSIVRHAMHVNELEDPCKGMSYH